MNFLSHYYLHRKLNNDYYDIGLTLPDVLSLHSKNVRISEKFLSSIIIENKDIDNLLSGITTHLKLDSFFHKSDFFKHNVELIENYYKEFSKGESIAFYYSHILLEIMIDKVILDINPDIANDFYDLHKRFDFKKIVPIFKNLKNFDENKFLDFTKLLANSSFLNDYKYNKNVIISLYRVTTRMGLPIQITISEENFEKYIEIIFKILFDKINNFLIDIKRDFAP